VHRLAVSNIAWTTDSTKVLASLSAAGVSGIEVAPGKLVSWDALDRRSILDFVNLCSIHNLSVPSLQALFFGKPGLQLLGESTVFQEMKEHVRMVSSLAAVAGAEIMVFGAPGNRKLLGHSRHDGERMACERLRLLAEIAWEYRTSIALEAVPMAYGGEMITSYKDSLDIVRTISHPGLVFHLDAACTWLAGDSIATAISEAGTCLRHFHVSQPQLADFSTPGSYHAEASAALQASEYAGWLSIEMRETTTPLESLRVAVDFANDCYQTGH